MAVVFEREPHVTVIYNSNYFNALKKGNISIKRDQKQFFQPDEMSAANQKQNKNRQNQSLNECQFNAGSSGLTSHSMSLNWIDKTPEKLRRTSIRQTCLEPTISAQSKRSFVEPSKKTKPQHSEPSGDQAQDDLPRRKRVDPESVDKQQNRQQNKSKDDRRGNQPLSESGPSQEKRVDQEVNKVVNDDEEVRSVRIRKKEIIFKIITSKDTIEKKIMIETDDRNAIDKSWIPTADKRKEEYSKIFMEPFDIFNRIRNGNADSFYFIPIEKFMTQHQVKLVKRYWINITGENPEPIGYALMDRSNYMTHYTGNF